MAVKKNMPAKVLSEKEQRKSLIGSKKKKTVVKTILENPFALNWPILPEGLEGEISSQLQSCCCDLKLPVFKSPREKPENYCPKAMKTSFQMSQVGPEKYAFVKEALSHLVFGYNEVMKALERNNLAGILVKKDVEPSMLVQTFQPGCVNKNIPLIPLTGLDEILQREDTLAVGHNVMVIGLKTSVKEPLCRFHPLYDKIIRVQEGEDEIFKDFKSKYSTEGDDFLVTGNKRKREANAAIAETPVGNVDEDSKQNTEKPKIHVDDYNKDYQKERDRNISKYKLSLEEIQSYHLKRTNKCERVFKPVMKKAKLVEFESDILNLESSMDDILKEKQKPSENVSRFKETKKAKEKAAAQEAVGFRFDFFLDTGGNENGTVTEATAEGIKAGNLQTQIKGFNEEKIKKYSKMFGEGDVEDKKKKGNMAFFSKTGSEVEEKDSEWEQVFMPESKKGKAKVGLVDVDMKLVLDESHLEEKQDSGDEIKMFGERENTKQTGGTAETGGVSLDIPDTRGNKDQADRKEATVERDGDIKVKNNKHIFKGKGSKEGKKKKHIKSLGKGSGEEITEICISSEKAKPIVMYSYVSAKTKRIKNNSDRKSNKGK